PSTDFSTSYCVILSSFSTFQFTDISLLFRDASTVVKVTGSTTPPELNTIIKRLLAEEAATPDITLKLNVVVPYKFNGVLVPRYVSTNTPLRPACWISSVTNSSW